MVWIQILREMGAKYNAYDYVWDGDDEDHADRCDIDPIPEGYAGCLNQAAIRTAAVTLGSPVLIRGTHILRDGKTFRDQTRPMSKSPSRSFRRHTLSTFISALWILWTFNLLTPVDHEQIMCFAVFFTVAKSNGKRRTIMDCRLLNETSEGPPPVNLGSMGESMTRAAELGCTTHIQCDISHWFHLFKIPEDTRRFFGLQCRDKEWDCNNYFSCTTMPMGWAWAPFIAQCTTLTAILAPSGTDKNVLGIDYEAIENLTSLPQYIDLKNEKGAVIGFIQVVYDNIGIFLNDDSYVKPWSQHLKSCAARYNIKWKEMYRLNQRGVWDLLQGAPVFEDHTDDIPKKQRDSLVFLGAELQIADGLHAFRWRHDEKKFKKWYAVFNKKLTTARDVSKVVGILIWDRILALTPFSSITSEIDALRNATRLMKTKSDWGKPLPQKTIDDVEKVLSQDHLKAHWDSLMTNPWRYYDVQQERAVLFLASDATETSIAGVMLNDKGRVISHHATHGMQKTHIYTKEVLAIYSTVCWAQKIRRSTSPAEFRIAVDNKAAASACMRCYSTCPGMNKILLRLWDFMIKNNIKLRCIDIHTKLNVADLPSRRRPLTRKLAMATLQVLQGRIQGRPEWLYEATEEKDYLPLIGKIEEVPQDFADETDNIWVSMRALKNYNSFFDQNE